ncbi:MAG: hypothetical protein HOK41_11990 [Nitrospina sp.]|jgi:hypothetical protein|nr:hypothetical protein [Nitrospina sp.]
MSQIEKNVSAQLKWRKIIFNFLGLVVIFSFLLLLRAPLLVNADNNLNFDEAYQGSQILDLLNGGPVHFYYEGVSYAGIFLGLAAAPFFWLFGVSAFAYKIPATIAYSLYILSSFWLMKRIHPPAALTVVILMVFSPLAALSISVNNWQHNLIIFLGNIILLLFIEIKESFKARGSTVFMLGAAIGFSIYSYTFSILYIATIAILFVLTHDSWSLIREKISISVVCDWWKDHQSGKMKFVRIIDIVIVCFLAAILFSYVFGGFGVDIAGYSIFQINNLHKPVIQVLAIMVIRLIVFREDIKSGLGNQKISTILGKFVPVKLMILGLAGFIIGILPRILSILTGEVTRGGQGFDVDFNPVKLIIHLWKLVSFYIPEFFDIRQPISVLFSSEWSYWVLLRAGFAVVVGLMILMSIFSFFRSKRLEIKYMAQLKRPEFFPDLVFVVFPILLCSAVIMIQNGTLIRYLLPLHGVVSIWVAIYLYKILSVSKVRFAFLLLVWCGFFLMNTYSFYTGTMGGPSNSTKAVVRGFSIVKHENFYSGLLGYCESKNIIHVYSDMQLAAQINFFSKGNIIAGIYDQDKRIRRKNQILSSKKEFSIIISIENEHHMKVYKEFLENVPLKFSQELVDGKFWVLTDFIGAPEVINQLRHFIPLNF